MTATTQESNKQIQATRKVAVPPGLVDVAYIDGAACAAAGAMSISQWLALVKDEKAPKPVIRKPRFTRWLMSDVRAFLIQWSSQSNFEISSAVVLGKAAKASNAAKAKAVATRQSQSLAA